MPNKEVCCPCCPSKEETEDHRKLGSRLGIFDFDPLIGAGMPFWLERGNTIKEIIKRYINSVQIKHGIKMVSTPELGRKELYEISGHWGHYRENIFPSIQLDESDEYILRPMTCPHHILLYKQSIWHQKHLPVAFGENSKLYRYESSGGLFGLERTRCMELIDTHIFCDKNNITDSLKQALQIIEEVKKAFNIQHNSVVLALRDKDKSKFYDDDKLWDQAEKTLREFMQNNNLDFQLGVGDAAFYGPKIDFQIKTHLGKIITISTIQLDFLLPQKFNLSYLCGEKGEKETPIMIHLGIIGTVERFIAYLLERDNGWLPFWVSPIQVSIIPVNKKHLEISQKLFEFFNTLNIRSEIEIGDEPLTKKLAKVISKRSYGHIIVGDKEMETLETLISTLTGAKELAQKNWKEVISFIKHSRGKRENLTQEEYPDEHEDLIKWASLKI